MIKQDARKLDHKTLEAIRIRAIQQVQGGESPEVIIKALGFSRRCIYLWLAAYRSGGWDALKAGRLMGRPKKLSGVQIKWIYKTVTGKSPLQLKFPFALWTRDMIRTLIRRKYGIRLSLASVGRLLAQLGLTCQKPLAKAFEQNPSLVQKWLRKEYPAIQKQAKREGAKILFSDESGVRSDFHAGTTWAKVGQTPVVRHTGRRFSMNMISAVGARGELRFMVTSKRLGSRLFLEFLKRLIRNTPHKIFLIVDGHPAHRAKAIQAFLKKTDRLKLFFLPPYSPELNPDEHVWNDVKNNAVGRSLIETQADLKTAILSRLRHLQKKPAKIRSFFQSKTTRYAA